MGMLGCVSFGNAQPSDKISVLFIYKNIFFVLGLALWCDILFLFGWPGLGLLFTNAVSIRDHTVCNDSTVCNPTQRPFVILSQIYCLISAVCHDISVLCLESTCVWSLMSATTIVPTFQASSMSWVWVKLNWKSDEVDDKSRPGRKRSGTRDTFWQSGLMLAPPPTTLLLSHRVSSLMKRRQSTQFPKYFLQIQDYCFASLTFFCKVTAASAIMTQFLKHLFLLHAQHLLWREAGDG